MKSRDIVRFPRKESKLCTWIAAVTAGALALTACGANENTPPTSAEAAATKIDHKREAATAIAGRFTCQLLSVRDKHQPPDIKLQPRDAAEGARTTVEVTVTLTQKQSARPYLQEYANGMPYASEVTWLTPGMYATLPPSDKPYPADNNLLTGPMSHVDDALDQQTVTATFFPLQAYADGTAVTVWAGQGVQFEDDKTSYTYSGLAACGGMEFASGSWVYSANAPETGFKLDTLSFPKP